MRTPWIGITICLFGFVFAGYLFFGIDWSDPVAAKENMLHELFKFSITTVLVGGAALFYDALSKRNELRHELAEKQSQERMANIEKERARLEALNERKREVSANRRRRLEEFFNDITDAYNDIKFTRRELRRALEPLDDLDFHIDQEGYCELMRKLNRGQLKLEQYRRILESKPSYLAFIETKGILWIARAENYLRSVTKEYERSKLKVSSNTNQKCVVSPDSRLFQFVTSSKNPFHDGTAMDEHFRPLDKLFRELAKNIEYLEQT